MQDLHILFEDEHMLVVVKPQGTPVQPDKTGDLDLLTQLQQKTGQILGLLHRLDRPVGGVMVFAKTKQAETAIAKDMQAGLWKKYYMAVLCGSIPQKSGTWTDYLYKNARTNLSECVSKDKKGAKKAVLQYEVLQEILHDGQTLSLVKIKLETGRHHQIRVQTSARGVPIWGDRKYATNQNTPKGANIALWSYGLEGVHPVTKKQMTFCYEPQGLPFCFFEK